MIALLFMSILSAASFAFDLEIKIQDMDSEKGHVLYLVFKGEEGFPDQPEKSVKQGKVPAGEAKAGFVLKDLDKGSYAVSIIHDENDNDKLDTNFLGIPQEGVGFSNNPKLFFGAPSFKKCEFGLEENKTIEIKLKHF